MKDISIIKKKSKEILKFILKIFIILLIIYNFISILEIDTIFKKTGYDIIVVEKYQAQKKIKQNTLIIYKIRNNKYHIDDLIVIKNSDAKHIRRIVNVDETGKFITKGDDNYRVDTKPLHVAEIEGKIILKVPLVGIMFKFARTITFSILVCIYIFIYFAYSIHINNKKNARKRKRRITKEI